MQFAICQDSMFVCFLASFSAAVCFVSLLLWADYFLFFLQNKLKNKPFYSGRITRKTVGDLVAMTSPSTSLSPGSKATPSISQYKFIDTFVKLLTRDLQKVTRKNKRHLPNLSVEECKTLDELENNKDIIIKQSNKGGHNMIQDR